ncbi:MAG: hypothetical protein AAB798_02165 [Patescibacteria group bacterium]
MIKKILIGFALATLAILFLLWLATGGIRKIGDTARSFTNLLGFVSLNATSSGEFRLPWQPTGLIFGPDLSGLQDTEGTEQDIGDEGLNRSQTEYDALLAQTGGKTFGEPSSHRGKIQLADGTAAEKLAAEYVEIEASFNNTGPVGIAGWSLQSAYSGVRAYIPRGTNIFILGDINQQQDIYLNPGARAIISSKNSPIGTSFRENACTGYLAGLQTFTPNLSRNCPPGSALFSLTSENLRTYGDACFDFTESLPLCAIPLSVPSNLTPACRIFLANNLSYNGCMKNNRGRGGFSQDSWRIYLNSGGELWRNSHDVIRLLDAEGKTVDAISY